MRFIIDSEFDKKRLMEQITTTPLDRIMLQVSVDDDWKVQFFLIQILPEPTEISKPTKKKK